MIAQSDMTLQNTECRKDLGTRGRLHHWSRGHMLIVRCCGHIDTWKPTYK